MALYNFTIVRLSEHYNSSIYEANITKLCMQPYILKISKKIENQSDLIKFNNDGINSSIRKILVLKKWQVGVSCTVHGTLVYLVVTPTQTSLCPAGRA